MLDHVALNVTDYERSRTFYVQALEPLGIGIVMEMPEAKGLGLGEDGKPYLWICERGIPSTSTHVALAAPDARAVDAFFEAGSPRAASTMALQDRGPTTTRVLRRARARPG